MSQHASAFTPWDNPMGTAGFEFIEYAAPDPVAMGQVFERMGFKPVARHRHKNVLLYRQGSINFIVNAEPDSFARRFARQHGPSVCAIAFRVQDAKAAYERATSLGAWGFGDKAGPGELNIPAIKGIGDSLIYLVDRWRGKNGAQAGDIGNIGFYDVDFEALPGFTAAEALAPRGNGLTCIDHLTHNVHSGRMKEWTDFYQRLFGMRETQCCDAEGRGASVRSKAMTSPCGNIRIAIAEESQEQLGEPGGYSNLHHAEGIQHIAMGSDDLYQTVDALRNSEVTLRAPIDSYYERIDERVPGHGESIAELQRREILIDGKKDALLLQAFSANPLGSICFEFIQRKGENGLRNGNFRALFKSIELDQIRRGVLAAAQ